MIAKTTTAAAGAVIAPPLPRKTDLLKVSVQENDPALNVKATAFGFKVTGSARNNGIVASFLRLSFDKKTVNLDLSRGDTGDTVFTKLKKALPKGYEARVLENAKSLPPQVTIGIAKKATPPPAVSPAKIPTNISANNASANVESSIWVNRMPGPGPATNKAIGTISVSGVGFADAPPTFSVKSLDVYEKGTNKKVFSIANPRLQDSNVARGQKTQTYRIEIPLAKLDLGKQYTVVANTGINGAKAQKVRSEYGKIGQAF